MNAAPVLSAEQYKTNARARAGVHRQSATKLASVLPADSTPVSSYALDWHVKAHCGMFPNGTGARPKWMSEDMYTTMLAERYPSEQFQNVGFTFDAFNHKCVHANNMHANLIIKQTPGLAAKLKRLTTTDVSQAIDAVGLTGSRLTKRLRHMTPRGKTYLSTMKRLGTRTPGGPLAKLGMRSKVMAAVLAFGSFTTMMNLCMSETAAHWVFEMAGHPYTFDVTGHPIGRPEKNEARRIVAANFFACASFFDAYFRAFNHVFLGWDFGAEKQHNIRCFFGYLLSFAWSYEESKRKGCHGHGTAHQLTLQVDMMLRLFRDPATRKQVQIRLFNFAESIMASYLPNLRPCG